MLHPTQFEVNEAWLAFKLNETPICTEMEGDFDCIALMDAASGFILGNAFAPAGKAGPSTMEVRRLLEEAKAHRQELPQTIFIPSGQFGRILAAEAERQGIAVVRVPEEQLLVFIDEARASFKEHFGGGSVQ
jgi:threonine synthase